MDLSSPLTPLVIRLEAWVQEELDAQARLLRRLDEHLAAVDSCRARAVIEAGEALEDELRAGPARERRRRALVGELARRFGVAPDTLTLASIATRASEAGLDVSRLRVRRDELRGLTERVAEGGRKLASLARYHQGLLEELVRLVFASAGGAAGEPALIDAEA